ncbi:MAG: DUF6268 family outer membrane beta-barrel protein [Candidatus Omnitrophota bacterium]|nr:DUF6268 family outer membrane beta-barrel protein [Candidatus Omnitrophota bacterium]
MILRRVQRISLGLFIIIATLTFFSSRLNAETQDEAENKPSQAIDSYVRYMPSRSVDAASGKVEIIESDAKYSYEFKAFDKLPVKLSIDNNYIGIESSLNSVELPAHLVGLTTDIETTVPFFHFSKTYLRIGISPSFYGDDWDFKASSFRIPSRYFLIYQPNDKWTFLSGVAVYPEFEIGVWPILGFIYKPNDKLVFNIIPKRPNITYALNDRISLFAEGGSALNSEFEVTRDNLKNIVLRYRETHLGAGIKFKLNQYIQTSISAGGMFNRYLKYKDSLGRVDIKDGLYTEFRVEIKS